MYFRLLYRTFKITRVLNFICISNLLIFNAPYGTKFINLAQTFRIWLIFDGFFSASKISQERPCGR